MTLTTPIVRINTLANNAKNVDSSCRTQNKNNTSFKGMQIELSGKADRTVNWLGDDFTSAMQRLVSGFTALMTQPFFDLNNDETDEKTRVVSCARTLGKIIAGTFTGVVIRDLCIRAVNGFCKNKVTEEERVRKETKKLEESGKSGSVKPVITEFKPHNSWLLPKNADKATYREIKKYKNAVGTFAAVGIMIFTNFIIDAPLTSYLTNFFTKKITGAGIAKSPAEGSK